MKEWTREEKYRYLKDLSEIKELHDRAEKSVYRQNYHIQAVSGLLNDPNGFTFFDGNWHLFYQWCPWGAVHGLKYWYHVKSRDLINWEDCGIGISPDEGDALDNKGAYSGSGFVLDDILYLYYTGNHRDADYVRHPFTLLASMDREGKITKAEKPLFSENPVYTEHQRDPKIVYIKEKEKYYIILGAQTPEKKGRVIVYKSDNAVSGYEFAGELSVPGYEDLGIMWECPSIEHIDGKDVLIFCPQHLSLPGRGGSQNHNTYLVGKMDWDKLVFLPEGKLEFLDFGFDFYAAACAAGTGRHILSAWMGLPDVTYPTDEEEWSGCLTLPRELSVKNGRLIQKPVKELESLRKEEIEAGAGDYENVKLPKAAELLIKTDAEEGSGFSMRLFAGKDGQGGLSVSYDASEKKLEIDRSGMDIVFNESEGPSRKLQLSAALSELRVFIDSSSVEIFVNDGEAVFTSRVFSTEHEKYLRTDRGKAEIKIWSLK